MIVLIYIAIFAVAWGACIIIGEAVAKGFDVDL